MPTLVTREFRREAVAVPAARSFVRRTLDDWGITDRSDDMLTCVSELATNVIRYDETPDHHFLVTLSSADALLRIEVHDGSRRRPRMQSPGVDSTTGRGLLLVHALADGWGVEPRHPRGKITWTEFKITTHHDLASPC